MMSVVSRGDIGVRFGAVLRDARNACIGLGYSAVVCAAGLALWGWLVAAPSAFAGVWDPFDSVHQYAWRNQFPVGPAASVVCIAAALIGLSVYGWWRRGRPLNGIVWLISRVLAACAVLYFAALSFGLAPFYHLVMANYPVTPGVPMVVASWLLGFGGAVALLAAAPLEDLTRKAMPALVGGVFVGVIAALVLTTMAIRAGDDRRYVDATLASSVDVPATPATFGQRRFSLKVSNWQGSPANQPDVQVAAAGTGFVVFHGGQVTGYGSDGKERWHYRRTGPGRVSVTGFRVFDEGRTVVAAVAVGPTNMAQLLVGLDAVTGHQLWSARSTLRGPEADSFHPSRNTHGSESHDPSPFLIADRSSDSSAWTRVDTRTGKPVWTVDAAVGRDCYGQVADTPSRIATATVCFGKDKVDVGVVVLDPESGQKVWQATLARDIPHRQGDYSQLVVTPAGFDGVGVYYGGAGRSLLNTYVNVTSHVMRDLGPRDSVEASPERGDVFVVRHFRPPNRTDLGLYDSDGVQRCTLSPGTEIPEDLMGDYHLYLPLVTQVLLYDRKAKTFKTIDKNTCAVLKTQPTSPAADWLAAAPGAVLVERIEIDGTYVDGYA
jgi:PQQ-like domain